MDDLLTHVRLRGDPHAMRLWSILVDAEHVAGEAASLRVTAETALRTYLYERESKASE